MNFIDFSIHEKNLYHLNLIKNIDKYNFSINQLSDDNSVVAGLDGFLFVGVGSNNWERQFSGEINIDNNGLSRYLFLSQIQSKS